MRIAKRKMKINKSKRQKELEKKNEWFPLKKKEKGKKKRLP